MQYSKQQGERRVTEVRIYVRMLYVIYIRMYVQYILLYIIFNIIIYII